MAVPFPFPLEIFVIGPAVFGGVVLLVWLLPRLIGRWRQVRYDATVAVEQERFEILAPGRRAKDEATPRELIRALAVQERQGDDRGGKGAGRPSNCGPSGATASWSGSSRAADRWP